MFAANAARRASHMDMASTRCPKGGRGLRRSQHINNHSQHLINTIQHIMIPKAQHTKVIVAHPDIARRVGRRFEMLAAVDLDDKVRLNADEICDVWSNRVLFAEAKIVELASAQMKPEPCFRVGHVLA